MPNCRECGKELVTGDFGFYCCNKNCPDYDVDIFVLGEELCLLCGEPFIIGEDGNELGFCVKCQEKPDFPYDLDAYYKDYDTNKVAFKGFDTMERGLLEPYRR